ncbi:MAG: hypothetical protein AAF901_02105 [Bacteroidota bacterium]
MSDKKNIDRLFQEKFKDFDVVPNDAVWERIHDELHNKKKKRRVIPIWWRVAGVAALLVLLFTVGNAVFNSEESHTLPVVDTEDTSKDNENKTDTRSESDHILDDNDSADDTIKLSEQDHQDHIEHSEDSKNLNHSNKNSDQNRTSDPINTKADRSKYEDAVADTDRLNKDRLDTHTPAQNNTKNVTDAVASNDVNTTDSDTNASSNQTSSETDRLLKDAQRRDAIASNTPKSKDLNITEIDSISTELPTLDKDLFKGQSIEDAIAESQEDIDEKEKEEKRNRWSIAPNVAPVYFSSFGDGSPIHSQFNQNTKDGEINMSYGINGSYAITDRLKVRTGIQRVDLSYATNDVLVFEGAGTQARGASAEIGNINYKNNIPDIAILSSRTLDRSTTPETLLANPKLGGNLDQRLGFIEVPLELEYRLVDKKLGVNLIGGFSTFFLNENELYADIEGSNTLIGEANNVNDMSYSANFGIGVDYSISKQWNINLEPTFKYQINTFNNTFGDFQPFFIGVYTGLSFKF